MRHPGVNAGVARPLLVIAGLLLVGACLRGPITGIAPVLKTIQEAFSLSPTEAGFLTTLPLIAFGVLAPFASIVAREYGLERTLFSSLLLIVCGVVVRSLGSIWCLYAGTGLIGIGIAMGNVLLPSAIKRDFPARVPVITGMCAIAIGSGAALSSVTAVPLTNALGWQIALGFALLIPLIAVAVWSRQLATHNAPAAGTATPPHGGPVWHSALAWQVTLFMGLNLFLYYVLVGWLPSILTAEGFSPSAAGSLHGVMQLAWAIPGFLLGPIVARSKDQKLLAAMMGVQMLIGVLGLCLLPRWATVWTISFGLGSGGGVLLAMMFIGMRVANAQQAAALSGMVQCVGNLLAAFGPPVAGSLHDATGSWNSTLIIGAVLAAVMVGLGALAGRPRVISTMVSPNS